jgi:hypothetical protein
VDTRTRFGPRTLLFALVGAVALLLAACPADDDLAIGEADNDDVTIEITSPQDGASVEAPFDVEFTVTGVEIDEIDTGEHHLHVYVADREFDPHYSTDPYTVSGVDGEVEIRIEVAQANHNEIGVSDSITVTAAGDGAADMTEDEAEEDEDDGPASY